MKHATSLAETYAPLINFLAILFVAIYQRIAAAKMKEVHTLVNDAATKAQETIERLQGELRTALEDLKRTNQQ